MGFSLLFLSLTCSQELNNNGVFRKISNTLDKVLPKDNPVREGIHGVYHDTMYVLTGNAREHERAKDKFHKDGRTDHLENFDKTHKTYKPGNKYNSKETN